jgi:GT2 family glycosyltransferase
MALKCSVVMPYYKNREPLLCTLESLARQTLAHADYEVIVVDDGSSDADLSAILAERGFDYELRYCSYPANRGAGHARNTGMAQARGEVVLFLDSDQVFAPDFLAQHLAFFAHVPDNQPVLQIGLRNDIALAPASLAEPAANVTYTDPRFAVFEWYSENLQTLLGAWHLGFSHNFSIRRRDLDGRGGFDAATFSGWGLEDCEFVYRLVQGGVKLVYNPNVLAYHLAHPVSWNCREGFQAWNRNLQAFATLHPDPAVYAQSIFRDFFDPERRERRLAQGDKRPWLSCYRRFEHSLRAIAGLPALPAANRRVVKDIGIDALRQLLADDPAVEVTVFVPKARLDIICHVQLHPEGKRVMLFTY